MLVVETFAATDLCHIFEFPRPLLLELIVSPTDRLVVMSQSKSIIIAALNFFDSVVLEYPLHVNLL